LLRVLEEDCGIKIFHREFEPTGTAACVKSEQVGWAILLNARNAAGRRNFDLAHELFHLLVWDLYRGPEGGSAATSSEQEEQFANAFASCLLIPAEALRRAVDRKRNDEGKVAAADLPQIARQFGVSVEALMWRIHRVYNFAPSREEETKRLIEAVKNAQTGRNEPEGERLKPPVLPDRYRALAIQALKDGEMSVGKFAEFMEVSRREAMSYMEMEEYALGEVQLTPA
jgi:Zn-dependent peptidase ImmA (M78 family)